MYRNLDAYLRDTLYIHQPLPLPEEGRLEEALAQKIPLERRDIAPAHALEALSYQHLAVYKRQPTISCATGWPPWTRT